MTLKEADEAAQKGLPIRMQKHGHPAVEYSRITRTGCVYLEDGRRGGYVELLDKNNNSVTEVDPKWCAVVERRETDARDSREPRGDDCSARDGFCRLMPIR